MNGGKQRVEASSDVEDPPAAGVAVDAGDIYDHTTSTEDKATHDSTDEKEEDEERKRRGWSLILEGGGKREAAKRSLEELADMVSDNEEADTGDAKNPAKRQRVGRDEITHAGSERAAADVVLEKYGFSLEMLKDIAEKQKKGLAPKPFTTTFIFKGTSAVSSTDLGMKKPETPSYSSASVGGGLSSISPNDSNVLSIVNRRDAVVISMLAAQVSQPPLVTIESGVASCAAAVMKESYDDGSGLVPVHPTEISLTTTKSRKKKKMDGDAKVRVSRDYRTSLQLEINEATIGLEMYVAFFSHF